MTDVIIKNLKQTLSKPIGDHKMRKNLEARLKALQDGQIILKA